jgi:hypothetical protein
MNLTPPLPMNMATISPGNVWLRDTAVSSSRKAKSIYIDKYTFVSPVKSEKGTELFATFTKK